MPSATQFIRSAKILNGTIDRIDPLETNELLDGLVSLNDMLDSWSIDRTYVFSIKSETFNLIPGTVSYSIGQTGTFNTDRPNKITNVKVTINGVNYPLSQLTDRSDYDNIAIPTNQGVPLYYYYDTPYPLGTLFLYPVINQAATITIDSLQKLSNFADLTTQYTFPSGYNRAIRTNLAIETASEDNSSILPSLMQIAMESKAAIKRLNLPKMVMKSEVAMLSNRSSNFYAGT